MCLDTPSPPSASTTARETLQAQVEYAPQVYAMNQQYSPLYTGLTLNNLSSFLNGTPGGTLNTPTQVTAGQSGWYDPSGNFVSGGTARPASGRGGDMHGVDGGMIPGNAPSAGDTWYNSGNQFTANKTTTTPGNAGFLSLYQNNIMPALTAASTAANTATRTANIADATNLAPQLQTLARNSNPGGANLLDSLTNSVTEQLGYGTQLTPQQQLQMQQGVRGAQAARGLGNGPGDVFNESMAETGLGQSMLQQRQQNAAGLIPQIQNFYGNPLQEIGAGSSNTVGAGNIFSTAGGSIAPSQSAEFDPTGQFAQLMQQQGWESSQANAMNNNYLKTLVGGFAQSY